MSQYEFELNMDDTYYYKNWADEWGCASLVWQGSEYGCEYNYCIDGEENYSAIYLYYYDKEADEYTTDTSCYRHYEIEWGKDNWADRLKAEMIRFLQDNSEWYLV